MARRGKQIENKDSKNIPVTGNTVIDALYLALDKIKNSVELKNSIIKGIEERIMVKDLLTYLKV